MSYLLRMSLVCAAAFFLVHLALAFVARCFAPALTAAAGRMRPAAGARHLFALRMLPSIGSLLAVAALCVPSYLRFEHDAAESIGLPCLLLATLTCTTLTLGLVKGLRALLAVARLEKNPGNARFALIGFLRPRLLVSEAVRNALSASQWEAALLHEDAHRRAGDNWKRLAILLTPGFGLHQLEADWARLAEFAADDAAVQAQPLRALALAEALLRVARLAPSPHTPLAAVSTLVASSDDLGRRVHRLLTPATTEATPPIALRLAASCAAAAAALAAVYSTAVLSLVHAAMEHLVR